jgi:DNA-binding response OmpR family regulator
MGDLHLDGRRVLVVEDEFLLADDLSQALREAGAIVLGPAPTVSEALSIIQAGPGIDGALLDVSLGREMVFPVAELLQARRVPFCFTTGHESQSIPHRFASVARFEKPLNSEAVARAISSSLFP